MSSILVLIPARYNSSRFPGKPLALIKGQTMIERVYRNCQESTFECAVVTDSEEIETAVQGFGGRVLRVDDDVPSGSERIALAYERFFQKRKLDLVLNVQGDEPLLKGEVLKELASFHLGSNFDVATLLRQRLSSEPDFHNPNVVKTVWGSQSRQCFYFSRQALPFDRDHEGPYPWYQHVGIYSYRPVILTHYVKLAVSPLERLEKLEQLRVIENQMSIGGILTNQELIGVDVPEDVIKVEGVLS